MTARDTAQFQEQPTNNSWKILHLFNTYRLIIAGIILVVYYAHPGEVIFGSTQPLVFQITASLWAILSFISGFLSRLKVFPFQLQAYILIAADIVIITIIMHTSGGITSGIGTLLLVTVAASGILLSGRAAIAFAALATLSVLLVQGYIILGGEFPSTSQYTRYGLLGAALFTVAFISHVLAQRVLTSEALAERRGLELEYLAKINEAIIEQMQTGIIVIDQNNNIQLVNDTALEQFPESSNPVGNRLSSLSPHLNYQFQAWKSNDDLDSRPFRMRSDGAEFIPQFHRLENSEDQVTIIHLQDTAQLSHQAQQIKLASLGRLTASIAHEIRNPLSAISHAAQLLDESPDIIQTDKRLTEIIQTQSRRLDTIVESVLALSRKRDFKPITININEWLINFQKSLIEERGLSAQDIAFSLPEKNLLTLFDATHLEQIICNLTENGVRYSRMNEATRLLEIKLQSAPPPYSAYLDICDYGTGVSDNEKDQLFEPFFTTSATGTGLGLYIARELSELNHAQLHLISSPTTGACFRLSIPHSATQIKDSTQVLTSS